MENTGAYYIDGKMRFKRPEAPGSIVELSHIVHSDEEAAALGVTLAGILRRRRDMTRTEKEEEIRRIEALYEEQQDAEPASLKV